MRVLLSIRFTIGNYYNAWHRYDSTARLNDYFEHLGYSRGLSMVISQKITECVLNDVGQKTLRSISLTAVFLMVLFGMLLVSPLDAQDEPTEVSGQCGENITFLFTLSTGSLELTGHGPMYDYKSNNQPWAPYRELITYVVIGDGITSVGNNAFYDCNELTSISLPDSLLSIGKYAFQYTVLDSIEIPDGVTTIGSFAFTSTGLSTIFIPSSVTLIEDFAFYQSWIGSLVVDEENLSYSSLDGVLYDKGMETLICHPAGIEDESFTIPDGVAIIYDAAFDMNRSLKTVVMPDSVLCIGDLAFANDSNLESVILSINLQTIGDHAFGSAVNLESVTLSDNLRTIGESAFAECRTLRFLQVPDSVEIMGDGAFTNEFFIDYQKVEPTIENLSGKTWTGSGDGRLYYRSYEGIEITFDSQGGTPAESVIYVKEGGVLPVFPRDPTYRNHVFDGWYSEPEGGQPITDSTTFSESTTVYAHWNDNGDSGICGAEATYVFTRNDGVLKIQGIGSMFDYHYDVTPWLDYSDSIKEIIIEDGISSIGPCAFQFCSSLTSVIIPGSVHSIGLRAFSDCTSLVSITIPNGVNYIGDYAFGDCTSLVSISIPASVHSIDQPFSVRCYSLTDISVDSDNQFYSSVDGVLFSKDMSILFRYPEGKQSESYTIPSSIISVREFAFYGCSSLVSVVIPEGVKSLGFESFSFCSSLQSITLPAGFDGFSIPVFTNCPSFTNIFVDSDNQIYCSVDGVLYCKDMSTLICYPMGKTPQSFNIPNDVTEISPYAFY